jgi:hypothetical protein
MAMKAWCWRTTVQTLKVGGECTYSLVRSLARVCFRRPVTLNLAGVVVVLVE